MRRIIRWIAADDIRFGIYCWAWGLFAGFTVGFSVGVVF